MPKLALPLRDREMTVLRGESGQLRRPALAVGRVEFSEVAQHDIDRPLVAQQAVGWG